MDNAQKAIMIGVGLFITIIIISAVLLVVNLGTGLVGDATSNLSSMSASLQSQILQDYDGKLVSGTTVRGAIQQYMSSTDVSIVLLNGEELATVDGVAGIGARDLHDSQFTIDIDTGVATIAADVYQGADEGQDIAMNRFTDVDFAGATFINTASRYNSYILRADGDAIVGIVFVPAAVITAARDAATTEITINP